MKTLHVRDLQKKWPRQQRGPGVLGWLQSKTVYQPVLNGVDFDIHPGEIVGFIGPNGSGKSTTMKILSGVLVPDAGQAEVLGLCPWTDREALASQIGAVFGHRTQMWWDLPVLKTFQLLRHIYRISSEAYTARLQELTDVLDLAEVLPKPARQLSLGMRMRAELAAALLHRPRLVFLDEPTIGLDAPAKLALRQFVQSENKKHGTTFLVTTHDLDDIEALCPRILVLGQGKILSDGSLDKLRQESKAQRRMTLTFQTAFAVSHLPRWENGSAQVLQLSPTEAQIHFYPNQHSSGDILHDVTSFHWPIADVLIQEEPIDNVVSRLYQSQKVRGEM